MKKNANILLHMHTKEARVGLRRISPDHTLGTTSKVVYIISFIWATAINLVYLAATKLTTDSDVAALGGVGKLSSLQQEEFGAIRISLILVLIATVLMTAALVLLCIKKYIPSLVLTVPTCIMLIIHFAQRMDIGISTLTADIVFMHMVPLLLLAISGIGYCVTGICFEVSENRAYTRFVEALYKQNSASFDKMTDEEWEAFLSAYEPVRPKKGRKARKAGAESSNKQ